MDIQFVVQFHQILTNLHIPSTVEALDELLTLGAFSDETHAVLKKGLTFLFRLESAIRLMSERSESSFDSNSGSPALLASLMGEKNWEGLEENYGQTTTMIRNVYDKEFGV